MKSSPPILMRAPIRVQRRRTKGWRMGDAVYVGRPTMWGNIFRVGAGLSQQQAVDMFDAALKRSLTNWPSLVGQLQTLRGRDLCCWCRLDHSCHADVLLKYANADPGPIELAPGVINRLNGDALQ